MPSLPSIAVGVVVLHLAVVTVPLVIADVRTLRLPNALVLPGVVVLVWAILATALPGGPSVLAALDAVRAVGAAALIGGGAWATGVLGMGDVKLTVWLAGAWALTGLPLQPATLAAAGVGALGTLAVVTVVASIPSGSHTQRRMQSRRRGADGSARERQAQEGHSGTGGSSVLRQTRARVARAGRPVALRQARARVASAGRSAALRQTRARVAPAGRPVVLRQTRARVLRPLRPAAVPFGPPLLCAFWTAYVCAVTALPPTLT
jgi:Flp pilus assembly protein protease CpaA